MYDQSGKGYRLTPVIDDSGEDAILLKKSKWAGGSYEFGDSLSLKAEQFIDLLPEAVTSSPIAQALANVADGYEADLSYGLKFNAGMMAMTLARQKWAASSILIHVQHVRLENIGRRKIQKHSGATAPQKTTTRQVWQRYYSNLELRDRLQRPDRFLISNENVQYNNEEKTLSFPLDEKKFGSIYTSTEKKKTKGLKPSRYHLNSTSATNICL